MLVRPIVEIPPASWDAAVDRSDEAWLFHRHAWTEIERSRFASAGHSFAIEDAGLVVGVCPLYERRLARDGWTEHLLDTGHHRHTGLALIAELSPSGREAARALALDHITRTADGLNVDRIFMNAHNLAPAVRASIDGGADFWPTRFGFEYGLHVGPNGDLAAPGVATPNLDQIVSLDADDETLFARLESSCRRAVRKANAGGIVVRPAVEHPVDSFYALAERSAARTGESLQPKDYYEQLWSAFAATGRCAALFADAGEQRVAGLFLLIDKQAASFFGGVSDPDFLPLRVNDKLHWEAIRWARSRGLRYYRLGPIFPALPLDWPISRVSRFKAKFGGASVPIAQASLFRQPQKFQAHKAVQAVSQAGDPIADVRVVLRRYGFLGFAAARAQQRDDGWLELGTLSRGGRPSIACVLATQHSQQHGEVQPAGAFLYDVRHARWYRPRTPVYRALLPFHTLDGSGLEPIWVDERGRPVIAWDRARHTLWVGLLLSEEITRYVQGDPALVASTASRARFGFEWERPNFLYESHILPGHETEPWADRLGFAVAELLAQEAGLPLIDPIPNGGYGAIVITGDDDQALLERYRMQLDALDGLPITYYMHILTKHTPETIAVMPANVDYGVHPDALEAPARYEELCVEQCAVIRTLCNRPARTVRNHGFLSDGYWGHLPAWERTGLELDFNTPGVNGCALTGSLLPFRLRRRDGSWSEHFSMLTVFGDGMQEALKWSGRKAASRVRMVARQVERRFPALLVFNLHPMNIITTKRLHRAVATLGRRRGWTALTAEALLDWLKQFEQLELITKGDAVALKSSALARDVAVRVPVASGWQRVTLPSWVGEHWL
ncbi:MAG TPA: GNAT family N-acetyltransferase [Vicinamibacterales bacterium]|nr:GNAT family N-acetyltransferase [Vicinamibacterales bacterium]